MKFKFDDCSFSPPLNMNTRELSQQFCLFCVKMNTIEYGLKENGVYRSVTLFVLIC
jgi:hypothetical protein